MMQVVVSGVVTIVVYAMIVAGVMKLFQIATDLGEIKDALNEIKRNTRDVVPPAIIQRASAIPDSLSAMARPLAPVVAQPDSIESPR
jgi:hypothetical protein